jgi:hypothetical protein
MATSQGYIDASTREQRNAVLSLRTTAAVRTLAASLNDRDTGFGAHADAPFSGAAES